MDGLGWSAVTLASHFALILSLGFAFWNAVFVRKVVNVKTSVGIIGNMLEPILFFGIVLGVERAYYVGARALVNSEMDLWEMHPVPEVLSALLALTAFWVAASIRGITGFDHLHVIKVVLAQAAFIFAVAFVLALVLR